MRSNPAASTIMNLFTPKVTSINPCQQLLLCALPIIVVGQVSWIIVNKDVLYEFHWLFEVQSRSSHKCRNEGHVKSIIRKAFSWTSAGNDQTGHLNRKFVKSYPAIVFSTVLSKSLANFLKNSH